MKPLDRITELSNQLIEGNLTNFNEFFELTKQKVFYAALAITHDRALSEDVLQDTFISFLNSKERLKKNTSPLAYLLTTARNTALNVVKKRNLETTNDNDDEIVIAVDEHYSDEEERTLAQMRRLLKPDEYEIVVLHIFDDLPQKTIAKILKKPLGTISWAYRNAINKLAKGMAHDETS